MDKNRGQIHTIEVPLPLETLLEDLMEAPMERIRLLATKGYAVDMEDVGGWVGTQTKGPHSVFGGRCVGVWLGLVGPWLQSWGGGM